MRRLVCGDMHGAFKALKQVLEKCNFDPHNDQLIFLGDVADGWPEVSECFDLILSLPNVIYIRGNHDDWLLNWFNTNKEPLIWTGQGGKNTLKSYRNRQGEVDIMAHRNFLAKSKFYYVTEDSKLFVHGGFDWHSPIEDQDSTTLMWDRELFEVVCMWDKYNKSHPEDNQIFVKQYGEVFIGHTSTSYTHPGYLPVHVSNVWNVDQGAGWEGKLTIMDVDTKEFWQSDLVTKLYPNEKGRF